MIVHFFPEYFRQFLFVHSFTLGAATAVTAAIFARSLLPAYTLAHCFVASDAQAVRCLHCVQRSTVISDAFRISCKRNDFGW
jgi:hypothetical protein